MIHHVGLNISYAIDENNSFELAKYPRAEVVIRALMVNKTLKKAVILNVK